MSSNVTKFGKIRYIEPNSMLQDRLYGDKVTGPYNITHDMEDYSISVDLVVIVPNRNGVAGNKTHVIPISDNNEEISFFGGSLFNNNVNLLTDTPGTTTYFDVINKDFEGNHENLGITNISISYNSYFYPQVVIKFTDVRGSALMMPMEENYSIETINAKNGSTTQSDEKVKSFFNSLFTFPYPEFKLRVKGFYGKSVEYSLIVEDFRSSFNAETGNFDATVKFMGKMFGEYTDIPVSYLIMAPYCRYGGTNNKTIWQQKNFELEGVPMPTFIELREKLIEANDNLKSNMSHKSIQKYAEANKRLSALNNIEVLYEEYYNLIIEKGGDRVVSGKISNEDILLLEIDETNKEKTTKGSQGLSWLYPTNNNEVKSTWQNLSEMINRYNSTSFFGTKLPFPGNQKSGKSIGEDNLMNSYLKVRKVTNDTNVVVIYAHGLPSEAKEIREWANKVYNSNGISCRTVFDNSLKYLGNTLTNATRNLNINDEKAYYIYYCRDFYKSLKEQIDDTKETLRKLRQEVETEYNSLMEELLGFTPSIRNIFKITFAHLQVFTEIYSTFLANVNGVNGRTLSEYGLSFERTDVKKTGNEKDTLLPPFPAILDRDALSVDENGNGSGADSYEYPSYANLKKVMEEENLIDSFFDGSFLMLDKENDNKILELNHVDKTLDFIPVNLTDFITQSNPYQFVFEKNNNTITVDRIMFFLGVRMFQHFYYEKRINADAKEWGKMEAYNFWHENQKLNVSDLKKFTSTDFSGKNFLNFLLGYNNPYTNGKPCYQFNDKTNALIKSSNQNGITPTGKFNFPAAISSYNGFGQDLQDKLIGLKSFPSGSTYTRKTYINSVGDTEWYYEESRAFDYIKLIDNYNFIKDWKNKIDNTDLSEFCDDDTKKTLIESQFKPLNGFYLDTTDRKNIKNGIFYRKERLISNKFTCKWYNSGLFAKSTEMSDSVLKNLTDLKGVYINDFEGEYYLDSIQMGNGDSYFLNYKDNPTEEDAERFLFALPFNHTGILDTLKNGKRLIRIPYIYQLFLGCCIKKIKNLDSYTTHETLAKLYKKYNFDWDYDSLRSLDEIIRFVLLQKGYVYHSVNTFDKTRTIDYLELVNKYEKWLIGSNSYDFKQLYNIFSVRFKRNVPNLDAREVITYIVKNQQYINGMTTYSNFFQNSKFSKEISNLFGSSYQTEKPQSVETVLNTIFYDFTNKFAKVSVDKDDLILHLNDGAAGYMTFSDFISKDSCLVLPYQMSHYDTKETVNSSQFIAAFEGFKEGLKKLYKLEEENKESQPLDYNKMRSDNVTRENKLSMYLTLKSLYDKHFHKLNDTDGILQYDINEKDSEFDRFHFIDSFYTDIGDKLMMNCDKLSNLIASVIGYEENGSGHGVVSSEMSLYTFMSEICRVNNMMLIAMPVFNGSFTDKEGMENFETMFTPLTYNDCVGQNTMKGPSYVCIYPHQPSYHLDMPNSQYANDGVDIVVSSDPYISGNDIAGTSDFTGPTSIRDLMVDSGDYIIPAFGVEYGIQNQGIFKSINVNMDNPQTTEFAVAAMFDIANMKSQETPRKQNYIGQDIFKVYANHSYTCTVEMMGCAQIQPLMYFELTNIPLFRGAYMIIKVEHNITPGNMTTTFTGVRISKNKIPMVTNIINLTDILDIVSNDVHSETDSKVNKNLATKLNGALQADLSGVDRYVDIPDSNYTYGDIIQLNKTKDVIKFSNINSNTNGIKGAFNESNPELRKLVYGIAKRAGETIGGITITSMTRTKAPDYTNKSSDHCLGNKVSQRRKELSGKNYLGEDKLYSEMGCAVDLLGNNQKGNIDQQESSIALFDLIALEYTENIRQLIWEIKEGACKTNNYISNCIHLSSYGHGPQYNDHTEIYVGEGSSFKSIPADNLQDLSKAPTNLPPMFIKSLYRLSIAMKDEKFKKISFNNFKDKDKELTKDLLGKWCEELGV